MQWSKTYNICHCTLMHSDPAELCLLTSGTMKMSQQDVVRRGQIWTPLFVQYSVWMCFNHTVTDKNCFPSNNRTFNLLNICSLVCLYKMFEGDFWHPEFLFLHLLLKQKAEEDLVSKGTVQPKIKSTYSVHGREARDRVDISLQRWPCVDLHLIIKSKQKSTFQATKRGW